MPFRNSLGIKPIACNSFRERGLTRSPCYPSFPVIPGSSVPEQGQNRDKITFTSRRLFTSAQLLYACVVACAAAYNKRRRPLIYTRYSCDMQSDRSNEDQEREVRLLFRRKGIDASDAYVIHDRAESATTNDRPGFNQMEELVALGLVSVVGVDDQARASRNDDVIGVVKDLVFRGVRFVSGDGVDTTEDGWKTKVRLLGIHNAISSEECARRVRRGMKGRVLDNKSAGDFPFGYESYFDDPQYAASWCGRGPKPTKSIRIYEPLAKWVRQLFEWVANGISYSQIAKKLQKEKVPVARNAKRWNPTAVSRTVRNKKYTGEEWTWGATMTIRDSKGKKKQVPAPADEVAYVSRPDLRIIDPELWARAQKQVARIDQIFGFKEGQKKRGAGAHFTRAYPASILFKLLRCGACNGEMHKNMSRELEYRQCKNNGIGEDDCRAKTRVPADETKRVLTEFAANLLLSVPGWLRAAIDVMNYAVRDQQNELPKRIAERRQYQSELIKRRSRLFELVETGDLQNLGQSQSDANGRQGQSSIRQRIEELDREIDSIHNEVNDYEQQLESAIQLPDPDFIAAQIQKLSSILRGDERRALQLLGELFDTIRVYRITPPGKQRGYHQLRFRLKAWRILLAAMGDQLPPAIYTVISSNGTIDACDSPEFCLNVGGPTRADEATDYIVKRRREGATWDEIRAETGLGRNTVRDCFRRHETLQQSLEDTGRADVAKPEGYGCTKTPDPEPT